MGFIEDMAPLPLGAAPPSVLLREVSVPLGRPADHGDQSPTSRTS